MTAVAAVQAAIEADRAHADPDPLAADETALFCIGAPDITTHGGWRAWLATQRA